MSVKLRLRRMGKKKRPYYRIVVADSRAARDGRFIETIGTYDPLVKPYKVELKEDRIFYWLGNGAQPTQTVKNLLQNKGLWLKWDLKRNGADDAKIAEEFSKWSLLREEKAKRLAAEEAQTKKAKEPAAAKDKAEEETAGQTGSQDVADETPAEQAAVQEVAGEEKSQEEKTSE